MAGDGEDDEGRRPSAGRRDGSPTPAPDPDAHPVEAWETWVAARPMFEALLARRIRTVQWLTAAVAIGALIVFVSALIVDRRPPGVALLWVLGGFAAVVVLVAGGDHVGYRTAWDRRTGTLSRQDIERRGHPPVVAVATYLRDSATAVEGQARTFKVVLTGSIFAGLLWISSALLFLG